MIVFSLALTVPAWNEIKIPLRVLWEGDWIEVARLGDDAIDQSLHPVDRIEWAPFIQAYAYLGNYEKFNRLYPIMADIRFLKFQECQLFSEDLIGEEAMYQTGQNYLREKFCH